MTITYDDILPDLTQDHAAHTIMAGNRLFVFNDGSSAAHGEDSTFRVYDDSGNLLIDSQRLTDATDEELAGYEYFGVNLAFSSNARHVQVHDDGSFTIHYGVHNPVLQRDTGANPTYTQMRSFSADGTPQAPEPGMIYINPDSPPNNAFADLPNGYFAESWYKGDGIHLRIYTDAETTTEVSFVPTGESYLGIVSARPASTDLVVAGNRIHLIYQDAQSGDVFLRSYGLDGTQIGGETLIGGDDNAYYARGVGDDVNTAVLTDGRIVLTWANQKDVDGATPELYQAILNADGSIARAPEVVNTDLTDGTQYGGQIFALSDGGYAIVYHTIFGTPYRQEALARQYDADGNPVGPSVAFEGDTPGQSLNAHYAAVFPNGFGYMLDGFGDEFSIRIDGQTATVTPEPGITRAGTDGDDSLVGGAGGDNLAGFGGNDTLRGLDGADTLNGGDGNDSIIGGESADDLRDLIYGGAGDDFILGGYGNDELNAGAGNDTVGGGFGADTIFGFDGDDVLTGEAWSDLIYGGAGADFINGGFGYDRVNGGAGADRFYHLGVTDHGSDWIQDYTAADGDVLLFGGGAATADDFVVHFAETAGAGQAGVAEAFVAYRPTGQVLWSLIDGGGQAEINLMAGGQVFDLLV